MLWKSGNFNWFGYNGIDIATAELLLAWPLIGPEKNCPQTLLAPEALRQLPATTAVI